MGVDFFPFCDDDWTRVVGLSEKRHAIAFEPFNLISSEQTIRSHFAANERTWSTAVRPDYMRERRAALSEREDKPDNRA